MRLAWCVERAVPYRLASLDALRTTHHAPPFLALDSCHLL